MKYCKALWLLLVCVLASNSMIQAATISAVNDGDWNLISTWDLNRVPIASDNVIIQGFDVTLGGTTNTTILTLQISNSTNVRSELTLSGSAVINVQSSALILSSSYNKNVVLTLGEHSQLNVAGNFNFNRDAGNNGNNRLQLVMQDSSTFSAGGMNGTFLGSSNSEPNPEILLENDAYLYVAGSTNMAQNGLEELNIEILNSSQFVTNGDFSLLASSGTETYITTEETALFQVNGQADFTNHGVTSHFHLMAGKSTTGGHYVFGGDVSLNSNNADHEAKIQIKEDDSSITIAGDLALTGVSENTVKVELKKSSTMYMGGKIDRASYGVLTMATDATLVLNGTAVQAIPEYDVPGSGTDVLQITNLVINNVSGEVLALEGDLSVFGHMSLTSGIIQSSEGARLIIEDGGTIDVGSASAYVTGPVVKRGLNKGENFTFPTGFGNYYGPINIAQATVTTSEYTAEYQRCPPPFGNNLALTGIDHISGIENWIFAGLEETDTIVVTLHWEDAMASGIEDLNDLIVAGLDVTNTWNGMGQSAVTGGTGLQVSGTVTNMLDCPPPFGVQRFTFASTSALNALPVELREFKAYQGDDAITLEWQTYSEVNSSHFIVEESNDGTHFTELTRIIAQGSSNEPFQYRTEDKDLRTGKNYYRLLSVDLDGMTAYSRLKAVNVTAEDQISLFPNPVKDVLHITDGSLTSGQVSIDISDRHGQLIYTGRYEMQDGILQIPISGIGLLDNNLYCLHLRKGYFSKVINFLKLQE